MNDADQQLIENIQSSGWKSVWAVTGGGVGAVYSILAHPGASRFVHDIRIPYGMEALEEFLGRKPESACSAATARLMAEKALERGTLGIGCTAALQTCRQRKGADRAFICICSRDRTVCGHINPEPGSRAEQDAFVSAKLLSMLAQFGAAG